MCDITTTAGWGPFHFLCVPGLVPDGPETFLRQLPLLKKFGSVSVVTYDYHQFALEAVLKRIEAEIIRIHTIGEFPILMGVSVGGGICLELLRQAREKDLQLPLSAVILVSPFTCTEDLAPLLSRLVQGIESESARGSEGRPDQAIERGRTFFRALASKSISTKQAANGWMPFFRLLTPQGLNEWHETRIRARIERTLSGISAQGAIDRVLSLRKLRGLEQNSRIPKPLTQAPTLILWGSKERHTLNMDGPGARILCRPDLASRHFPNLEVHWLYAKNGEEVPHASLLKHAAPFNHHLRTFLRRCSKPHGWFPRMAKLTRVASSLTPLVLLRYH